jgi:CRISPR-associated endonuclease Cas2
MKTVRPKIEGSLINRRYALPYLFSYDISNPANSRLVLKCLKRWRIDGQLSVHETLLTPDQAEILATDILDYIDPETDSLLLGRLSQRGTGPRSTLSRQLPAVPLLGPNADYSLQSLASGWYIVAYDIRQPKRLRRVQKITARYTAFLQRSVYLYHGNGNRLLGLLGEISGIIRHREDDVRLYSLSSPSDLWFLCGPIPPCSTLFDLDHFTSHS